MHGVGLRRRVGRQCIRHIGNLHRWTEVRQRCHGRRHSLRFHRWAMRGSDGGHVPVQQCGRATGDDGRQMRRGLRVRYRRYRRRRVFRNQRSRRRRLQRLLLREARQQSRRQVRRRVRRTPRHSDGVSGLRRSTGGTIAMESGASPITEGSPASKSSHSRRLAFVHGGVDRHGVDFLDFVGEQRHVVAGIGGCRRRLDGTQRRREGGTGLLLGYRVGQDRNVVVCARRGCGASAHRPARGVHAPSARIILSRKGCEGAVRNRAPCRTSSARGPRQHRRRRCRRFPQAARSG